MFTLSSCPSCSNRKLRYPPDKSPQLVFPQFSGSVGFPNTYKLDSATLFFSIRVKLYFIRNLRLKFVKF